MDRENIIKLAREAGAGLSTSAIPLEHPWVFLPDELERFAALVAAAEREKQAEAFQQILTATRNEAQAAEREACAKLAEETVCDTHLPTGVKIYGSRAAAAIRARGQA